MPPIYNARSRLQFKMPCALHSDCFVWCRWWEVGAAGETNRTGTWCIVLHSSVSRAELFTSRAS
jgi:hypothetical protein